MNFFMDWRNKKTNKGRSVTRPKLQFFKKQVNVYVCMLQIGPLLSEMKSSQISFDHSIFMWNTLTRPTPQIIMMQIGKIYNGNSGMWLDADLMA